MRAPSPPAPPPLPPAVSPLAPILLRELPFSTISNPHAEISSEGSVIQPLQIKIKCWGKIIVNIDSESIIKSYTGIMESRRSIPGPEHAKRNGDGRRQPIAPVPQMSPKDRPSKVSDIKPLCIEIEAPMTPISEDGDTVVNINFDSIVDNIDAMVRHRKLPKDLLMSAIQGVTVPRVYPEVYGLLSLPGEIRNRIYRCVLKDGPVNFYEGTDFQHSASLLRTCKQIHKEARAILYGENRFVFERDPTQIGVFWKEPEEVGYTNVRRFFEMIGPGNIRLIRDIGIIFEDGRPSATPYLDNDSRRYVNDVHCNYVLDLLGKHAKLDRINIALYGRRKTAWKEDRSFLTRLSKVPAKKVVWKHPRADGNPIRYYLRDGKYPAMKRDIAQGMVRCWKTLDDAAKAARKTKEAEEEAKK